MSTVVSRRPPRISTLNDPLVGNTLEAVIEACCSYADVKPTEDAVERDACDEPGRLDIQVMEDGHGSRPTDDEIERWKRGEMRLWLCTYSFRIEKVTREDTALVTAE